MRTIISNYLDGAILEVDVDELVDNYKQQAEARLNELQGEVE